jgi:uncharacterized protein (TIGR04255 family)
MDLFNRLKIDVSEKFPHLSRAPITEAVIEIRARASKPWIEAEVLATLKQHLVQYPVHVSARGFEHKFQVSPTQEAKVDSKDLGWQGHDFRSADLKQIVKFHLDLFSFSRLNPYDNWERFTNEALRLWKIHRELSQPLEVQRLGVRFINRIPITEGKMDLEKYFKEFPQDLKNLNLSLTGFLHHNIFSIPGYPYAMNIIKTVQPSEAPGVKEFALILDIDVYTQNAFEASTKTMEEKLAEMRWLKNKSFFSIITNELKVKLQ